MLVAVCHAPRHIQPTTSTCTHIHTQQHTHHGEERKVVVGGSLCAFGTKIFFEKYENLLFLMKFIEIKLCFGRNDNKNKIVKKCYVDCCGMTMLKAQGDSDLMSMLNCLVDRAYVRIEGKVPYNTASLNKCKVGLCVEEQDIKRAFQDKTLLSKLI